MRPAPSGDTGDIVVGWLVRLVAGVAAVGVLAFDGVSLGVARLGVVDDAASGSRAASRAVEARATPQAAYDAAWRTVVEDRVGVELPVAGFAVGTDGTATVTVERTVPTLVLQYVPGSEDWLSVSATSTHIPG